MKNRLFIAAAGSGKTTFIIKDALSSLDDQVLITTYTIKNAEEIRRKIIKIKGYVPRNITVQTWFSFLIQHGVKPYKAHFEKGLLNFSVKGLCLVNKSSAQFVPESNVIKHYFTKDHRIYSDKLSKFVVGGGVSNFKNTQRVNFTKLVIDRISRIYTKIYIDEVQDLAGYDLDILKLFFKSNLIVTLVGDPRQVTYLTHHENRYTKYNNGKIKEFILNECGDCFNFSGIDETTLLHTHRNNRQIAHFSSLLYKKLPETLPCDCVECLAKFNTFNDESILFLKKDELEKHLSKYNPVQLTWNSKTKTINGYRRQNLGESKGMEFEHVLIYPTKDMIKWVKNNSTNLKDSVRAKLYVGITRARYTVGIYMN